MTTRDDSDDEASEVDITSMAAIFLRLGRYSAGNVNKHIQRLSASAGKRGVTAGDITYYTAQT